MRALEKRISVGSSTGVDTDDSESSVGANGSPTSTTATSIASNPTSRSAPGKFEGAHLFAGHAEAVLPSHSSVISKAQLQALEDKLKAVEKELTVAKRKETELGRDLKMLEMEKTEVEFNLGQELQSAEETIQALNVELDTISEKEDQIRRLEQEKAEWEQEREELESSRRGDPLRRVEELEAFHAEEQLEWETMRGEMQETHAVEIAGLRAELEMANMGGGSASKEAEDELQVSRELLRDVLRAHRIVLPLRATSLSVLVSTLGGHLESMQKKLEDQDTTIGEWELERSHLEDDARVAQDQATVAGRDLEMARKELDQAKNDIRRLEMRAKVQQASSSMLCATSDHPFIQTQGSTDSFLKSPSPDSAAMFQLRSIWGALPSVEARSAKLPRGGRSPAGLPRKEGAEQLSISDLDVKSLKQLYDPARGGYTTPVVQGEFSLDDFINRVQALLIDDRLILERLIRFAQAHELLKNNAERAQKIAVESSVALETYQKQVRTLEERNLVLTQKQMAT